MKPAKFVGNLTVAALLALLCSSGVSAEDTKGKWQFGFGLSYFSTTDYIRSNADLAFSSGVVDERGLPSVRSVDERPDINVLNEPTIRDDFRVDFSASYGMTRWLALEAAVGLYKGPVGDIEFFSEDRFISIKDGGWDGTGVMDCGPDMDKECWDYDANPVFGVISNRFLPVGEITEIPIHLSGLVRFRPESPFDPYIGLGLGYILADLKTGREFNQVSGVVGDLHVVTASVGEFTQETCDPISDPAHCKIAPSPGYVPVPLEAGVKNAFEWHAAGGVDYYVSERFSFYIDARYVWTSGQVDIRTDSAHQVRFGIEESGQVLLETRGSVADPFLWEDTGFWDIDNHRRSDVTCEYEDPNNPGMMKSCAGDGLFATEERKECLTGQLETMCDPLPTEQGNPLINEDLGHITLLPPGSFDFDENLGEFDCPACVDNGQLDTEDRNDNQILDRYLKYGVDLCSRPESAGSPVCTPNTTPDQLQYTWPGGCPLEAGHVSRPHLGKDEGCPPLPAPDPNNHVTKSSNVDDTSDVFLIQGGRIRLGGFSLGVGFKFTF